MTTFKIKHEKLVEVTNCENGFVKVMSLKEFYRDFGKDEGKELLAGHHPSLVAIIK